MCYKILLWNFQVILTLPSTNETGKMFDDVKQVSTIFAVSILRYLFFFKYKALKKGIFFIF